MRRLYELLCNVVVVKPLPTSDPAGAQTQNLQNRNLTLYSIELRGRACIDTRVTARCTLVKRYVSCCAFRAANTALVYIPRDLETILLPASEEDQYVIY